MIEQLIFISASIGLFGATFFKMIKKNDTEYVVMLIIQAIGIIIDAISFIFNKKLNIFLKTITYSFSIIMPIVIIILEYKNIDFINLIKFAIVKLCIATNHNKEAKEILLGLVEKKSNNYKAHKMLAEIYEKEGGLRKAIDEYVICIDLNKKDYASYFKVATLLNELEKKDEAIEMLTNLLDKKPDYFDASMALGDLLIEKQSYKEAVSILTDALKYNPVSYELHYELGIVYTMLNDFQSAKECYEKAAEINSLMYVAKYNLAQIAMLYKDLDLAEEYFLETSEEEDLSADSYFELAKIKLMKGEKDIAIKYVNIAIDLNSNKIAKKVKKEPLFFPIMAKISIPFNLEEKETEKLTSKDVVAKEHLENTSDITMNMGYTKVKRKDSKEKNIEIHKEREN